MKPDTHPNYSPVVFRDAEADFMFLTRSTATSNKTVEWEDGNTYPVIDVEVSSVSHPFYTGKRKLLDTGGRLGRFQAKIDAAAAGEATEKPSKKKKAAARSFTPAVNPKSLAAKAKRAEEKALEDAKARKAAEEAAKREAEEAAAAAEAAAAEAEAAAVAAEAASSEEAPAAEADAPVAAAEEATAEVEATPEADSNTES